MAMRDQFEGQNRSAKRGGARSASAPVLRASPVRSSLFRGSLFRRLYLPLYFSGLKSSRIKRASVLNCSPPLSVRANLTFLCRAEEALPTDRDFDSDYQRSDTTERSY